MSYGTDKPENCVPAIARIPRCKPPAARERRTGQRSQPLTASERRANYQTPAGHVTPAQARRLDRKLGRALRLAGASPARVERGREMAQLAEPAAITARQVVTGTAPAPVPAGWTGSVLAKLKTRSARRRDER